MPTFPKRPPIPPVPMLPEELEEDGAAMYLKPSEFGGGDYYEGYEKRSKKPAKTARPAQPRPQPFNTSPGPSRHVHHAPRAVVKPKPFTILSSAANNPQTPPAARQPLAPQPLQPAAKRQEKPKAPPPPTHQHPPHPDPKEWAKRDCTVSSDTNFMEVRHMMKTGSSQNRLVSHWATTFRESEIQQQPQQQQQSAASFVKGATPTYSKRALNGPVRKPGWTVHVKKNVGWKSLEEIHADERKMALACTQRQGGGNKRWPEPFTPIDTAELDQPESFAVREQRSRSSSVHCRMPSKTEGTHFDEYSPAAGAHAPRHSFTPGAHSQHHHHPSHLQQQPQQQQLQLQPAGGSKSDAIRNQLSATRLRLQACLGNSFSGSASSSQPNSSRHAPSRSATEAGCFPTAFS
eukprot:gene5261-8031_t